MPYKDAAIARKKQRERRANAALMPLSVQRVKESLRYEPESGAFYWLANSANTKIGPLAGTRRKDGRLQIGVGGRYYLASRLAWFYMTGEWPDFDIDHIDRNKANDRFKNLRSASRSQNMANRAKWRGVSRYLGVSRKRDAWEASISSKAAGIRQRIGGFKTQEDAAQAYNFMAAEAHGEFAVFNRSV